MDNDKAIADAIAAMEPFANMICPIDDGDLSKGYAFDSSNESRIVFDIGKDRKITVGDLRRARYSRASLCALAPAPADQSDVPLWAHWSSASAMTDSNINKQFKIIETRRAELAAELKFRGHPPADENDAGRDGVPSRQEIALHFCTHTWAASERSIDPTIACEPCCKKADTIIRAIASAPSETVGRGEDEAQWGGFETAEAQEHAIFCQGFDSENAKFGKAVANGIKALKALYVKRVYLDEVQHPDLSKGPHTIQNNAGRDGVIEECAKVADDFSEEGRFSVSDTWRNDMTPTQVYQTAATDVGAWIAKDIRALASAPSETVGRGEPR